METNGTLPMVDLNALVAPVAQVKLDDVAYDVLPIQGEAMTIFEQIMIEQRARADGIPNTMDPIAQELQYLDRARRIVYAVAPTIPRERVGTMMGVQLTAIAELSAGPVRQVAEVRAQAEGKDSGPA